MNQYLESVLAMVRAKNRGEDEFHQAVEEVLGSLGPVLENHPEYVEAKIIERLVEPERMMGAISRLIVASVSSSTAPSALTRVACVSIPASTRASLNSWGSSRY